VGATVAVGDGAAVGEGDAVGDGAAVVGMVVVGDGIAVVGSAVVGNGVSRGLPVTMGEGVGVRARVGIAANAPPMATARVSPSKAKRRRVGCISSSCNYEVAAVKTQRTEPKPMTSPERRT
jgi:UDP-3-O-[3-hydroxymyristoyl] glucosamine N-acyltransferase